MESEGFFRARQKGSHLMMQRRTDHGTITVPVPLHRAVRIGRCNPSFGNLASRGNGFWFEIVPPFWTKSDTALRGSGVPDGRAGILARPVF